MTPLAIAGILASAAPGCTLAQRAPHEIRGITYEQFGVESYLGMRNTLTQRPPLVIICGTLVAQQLAGAGRPAPRAITGAREVRIVDSCADPEELERQHPAAAELLLLQEIRRSGDSLVVKAVRYHHGSSLQEVARFPGPSGKGEMTVSDFISS